jgi:hypothetical protein
MWTKNGNFRPGTEPRMTSLSCADALFDMTAPSVSAETATAAMRKPLPNFCDILNISDSSQFVLTVLVD